jgi:tol-pal system protein YbgF
MMHTRSPLPIILLLSLGSSSLWAATEPAQDKAQVAVPPQPSTDERIARIEQMLQNQSLLDMLSRIDALQQENRELRGELEEQTHTVNEMKQQQSDLYRDLDRRISDIERSGSVPAATAAASQQQANPVVDTPATPVERDAYQKAFDLLRELRYEQAIEGFRAFLKSYPAGRYAPSAQYWLAEAYYARREFPMAITEYQALRSRYPSSTKLPEALLKIGYCYSVLGKKEEAKGAFDELVKSYPQSPEAQQAEAGLQRLSGEAAPSR